jgi:hypothetical protein
MIGVAMPMIQIEIKNCAGCPFFDSRRKYTSDSFEMAYTWICKKQDKVVQDYVEWMDDKQIKVPDWCPCLVKESK